MKIIKIVVVTFAVVAIFFGAVGSVYAQSENPPVAGNNEDHGWMHDEMVAILAGKLGISESDLEARLDQGESLADIAAAEGLSRDEFFKLMRDARAELIDEAVKDGKISEQQAKWMKTRGIRMMHRWQEFRQNFGPQNKP
jgi:hypothetical protein